MITVRSNQWVGTSSLPPDALVTLPYGPAKPGQALQSREFTMTQIRYANEHHSVDVVALGYMPHSTMMPESTATVVAPPPRGW